MSSIQFCTVEPLDDVACKQLLARVRGEGNEGGTYEGLPWLLAHCDDGVTWGRWHVKTRQWQTGFDAFPEISPQISPRNLQELRLFGPQVEVLLWRTIHEFRGRCLRDTPGEDDLMCPMDEQRVLVGNRLIEEPRHGFSWVGSPTGAEQVVPLELTKQNFLGERWPLRLHVRHYFQQDSQTGAMRIAATRLIGVKLAEDN